MTSVSGTRPPAGDVLEVKVTGTIYVFGADAWLSHDERASCVRPGRP